MMKREFRNKLLIILGALALIMSVVGGVYYWKYRKNPKIVEMSVDMMRTTSSDWKKPGKYWETSQFHTPNLHKGKNDVKAVVLHHTASKGTGEIVAKELCRPGRGASCHVVIDTDGTRYVLARPEEMPFHAGYSKWGNRFRVNTFSIGIEFHGNTIKRPLTNEQIESAVEYLRPIIKKYNIKAKDIVTHQMVRDAYIKAIPGNKKALPKVDITPVEYKRVLNALDTANLLK
ncbi:MAG: peptidoglycan recognition protein family protein [Muribaculaceae bacterium]|nr:peptidoglycan recognition protein family protein [Muribaculaceae bacterium]MDE6523068.1 peptidoglycan recognition protein family protein [Muribaculaceae bacterium]